MGSSNSMSRETKKKQLKKQIVPDQCMNEEESREALQNARRRTVKRRLRVLMVFLLLAAIGAGLFLRYENYHQFTAYEVMWEKNLEGENQEAAAKGEGSFCQYVDFADGVLKYTKDGASYIDSQGKAIWIQSTETLQPLAIDRGTVFISVIPAGFRDRQQRCFRSLRCLYLPKVL